ncbi:MAG: sigma-70 family RNA polymerase sigma factor [Planctomycetes bacterium]|nr:sigma-70 family RNA polymerase sigma factor [Planctomycetota bacterium]
MRPQITQSNDSSLKIHTDAPDLWRQALPRLIPLICRMLTRRGIHPALAEELTQKTIFDAIRRRETYDSSKGTLEQWIFTIAKNNLALEMRQRQYRPKPDGQLLKSLEVMDSAPMPDAVLELAETASLVRKALSQLSEKEQTVLKDKYIQDRPARQIGKTLKISEKAVYDLLYRARISLREKLIQLAP